jgi:hypothetical protein
MLQSIVCDCPLLVAVADVAVSMPNQSTINLRSFGIQDSGFRQHDCVMVNRNGTGIRYDNGPERRNGNSQHGAGPERRNGNGNSQRGRRLGPQHRYKYIQH